MTPFNPHPLKKTWTKNHPVLMTAAMLLYRIQWNPTLGRCTCIRLLVYSISFPDNGKLKSASSISQSKKLPLLFQIKFIHFEPPSPLPLIYFWIPWQDQEGGGGQLLLSEYWYLLGKWWRKLSDAPTPTLPFTFWSLGIKDCQIFFTVKGSM